MLKEGGADPEAPVQFFAADLEKDDGWAEAVEGCDYVLHIASPFPPADPKHEDELIVPARDGALRVLKAAREAGVKRVVMTSSFAAVGYGAKSSGRPFDETDWTDPKTPGTSAYVKSKTIAERAAWDYVASTNGALELSVVQCRSACSARCWRRTIRPRSCWCSASWTAMCPAAPSCGSALSMCATWPIMHIRAMTNPAAKGERFLAVAGDFMSMVEIARMVKARMGAAAAKVPTRQLPNWMVRLAALRDPALKLITPELGKPKNATNAKARRMLGWAPRSNEDALIATAESLVRLGLLKGTKKRPPHRPCIWRTAGRRRCLLNAVTGWPPLRARDRHSQRLPMSFSIYDASVPPMIRVLESLSKILDKAVAQAKERDIPLSDLLEARLAPDMHPLTRQIQIASDAAKGCAARLAGLEAPSFPDTEASFPELQTRIAKTIAYLREIKPEQLAGAETRTITIKTPQPDLRNERPRFPHPVRQCELLLPRDDGLWAVASQGDRNRQAGLSGRRLSAGPPA